MIELSVIGVSVIRIPLHSWLKNHHEEHEEHEALVSLMPSYLNILFWI